MKIQDLILKTEKIDWQILQDLQPENLKTNFHGEKTKQSIIDLGFSQAIYVWQDPEDNQIKIIDGHLRADILRELVNDGYNIPQKLSCTFLDNSIITNKEMAIKYLLRVFNVKRNPIDTETLENWLEEIDLSVDDVCFDDLDIKIAVEQITDEEAETGFPELKTGGRGIQSISFTLTAEQVELVQQKIKECKKSEEFKYCETFGNENSNGNALYCLLSRL
jgi:hypothetical protein